MRKIIISGTSTGIGNGLANAYLEKGFHVIGIGRNPPKNIESTRYQHIKADFSQTKSLYNTLEQELINVGDIDLIILNSGILGKIDWMKNQSLDDLRTIMNINVWANKISLDYLFSLSIKIKQVVAISSGAAHKASNGWGPYAISKAALNTLITAYANERMDTHFCAMAPGLVDTEIQKHIRTLPVDDQFPTVRQLQEAHKTPIMPNPQEASKLLTEAFEKALSKESGSYLDVRTI